MKRFISIETLYVVASVIGGSYLIIDNTRIWAAIMIAWVFGYAVAMTLDELILVIAADRQQIKATRVATQIPAHEELQTQAEAMAQSKHESNPETDP